MERDGSQRCSGTGPQAKIKARKSYSTFNHENYKCVKHYPPPCRDLGSEASSGCTPTSQLPKLVFRFVFCLFVCL